MPQRRWAMALVIVLNACSMPGPDTAADAIPDVSAQQQRTIWRSELKWLWPLSVGTGVIGCDQGAVIFRSAGKSYALNDAASARGFADIGPIWQARPSGPPRNPLRRLKQSDRMQIFIQSMACESRPSGAASVDPSACKQAIRARRGLSEAELTQIEAEGDERSWPPLERATRASLDPLIDTGLQLCAGAASG